MLLRSSSHGTCSMVKQNQSTRCLSLVWSLDIQTLGVQLTCPQQQQQQSRPTERLVIAQLMKDFDIYEDMFTTTIYSY